MTFAPFVLKVPASSANIGPGFDVLGIGLNLYLEISVHCDAAVDTTGDTYNAHISYSGPGNEGVPLNSCENLISKTALYVLRCNGITAFPEGTHIHVNNPIPLGRGLGSLGAAIVGGVMLANEIGGFGYSKERMLDYCLLIERHPDNIAATMLGGFVGSYLSDLSAEDTAAKSVPLEYILPTADVTPEDKIVSTPPPKDIAFYAKYNWCTKIRCVAVIPKFELSTDLARSVLPEAYTKQDIVYNLQRLAVLTTAVTLAEPNHRMIYQSMKDKLHQPYRSKLIPGLTDVLESVNPETAPGLCGVCLSGAGPTILCLATDNFEAIANQVMGIFKTAGIECSWKLLDLAYEGATVSSQR